MMQRKVWTILIKRNLAALVVVYVVAALMLWPMSDSESGQRPLRDALWAVPLYLVFSLIFATVNALAGLVYLWFDGGRDLEEIFLGDLRALKLAAPLPSHPKTAEYLTLMVDDPDEDVQDRIRAAMLAASLRTTVSYSGLFGGLAWQRAADNAVLRYAQEAPSRPDF